MANINICNTNSRLPFWNQVPINDLNSTKMFIKQFARKLNVYIEDDILATLILNLQLITLQYKLTGKTNFHSIEV